MNPNCHNLDDFLAGDLPTPAAGAFTAHLPGCDQCREAVDQQQWIDNLLRTGAELTSAPPREKILVPFREEITRRRQRQLAVFGLAAAATLLIALGWLTLHRPTNHITANKTNSVPIESSTAAGAAFVTDADSITVPVQSSDPDVTVVRVYSTYQPQSDPAQLEPDTDSNFLSNGG
jgi:anti-sigma factor RsiW